MEELKMTGKELIELMAMFREALDEGIDKTEAAIEKLSGKEAVHSVEEDRAKDFVNETKKRYPKITDNPPKEKSTNTDDTQNTNRVIGIDDIVRDISFYTGVHTEDLKKHVMDFVESMQKCKEERCEKTEDDIAANMREETRRKYLDLCKRFPIFKYMTTAGPGTINDAYDFFTNNKVTSDPVMSCGNGEVLRKTILSTTTPDIEVCMCLDMNEVFASKYLNDLQGNMEDYKGLRVNLTVNSKYKLTGEFAEYYPHILSCYFNTINCSFPTEKGITIPFKFDTIASKINKCDTYWNYNMSCAIDFNPQVNAISCGNLTSYMSSIGLILELFVRVFMMINRTLNAEIAKQQQNANKSRANKQLLSAFIKLTDKFDVLEDIINMPRKSQARIVNLFEKYSVKDSKDLIYNTYRLDGVTAHGTHVVMYTDCPKRSMWSSLSTEGYVSFKINIEIGRSRYLSAKLLSLCGNTVLKLQSIKSLSAKVNVDFTGSFDENDGGGAFGCISVDIGCRDRTSHRSIADAVDACKQMIVLAFINTLSIIGNKEYIEESLEYCIKNK